MPQLLGDILVRARAITPRQLDDAISNQVIYGGRLGTNLMDLGYINESVLGNYLSVQHGVSTVAPQAYAKMHVSVAKLLPKALAERLLAVPMVKKDKVLHVVMANPGDVAAQDELAFASGCRLQVYVAPEVRIYFLLNRLYGTKRDVRYVTLSRTDQMALRAGSTPAAGGGAAVVPEAPRKVLSASGVAEKGAEDAGGGDLMDEAEFTRLTQGFGMTESEASGEDEVVLLGDVQEDESELIVLGEAEDAPAPAPAAEPEAPAQTAAPAQAQVESPKLDDAPPPPRQLTLQQATKALQHVEDRDQIARVVLGFASATFKRNVLFAVRTDMVMGWDGFGGNIRRENIEQLMIPLGAPSVFKTVCEMRAHFLGAIPKTPINNRFLKLLGGKEPRSGFVIPIVFKGKVVNILYGDNGPGTDATFDIGELLILAMKVPQSFEDLVRRRKGG